MSYANPLAAWLMLLSLGTGFLVIIEPAPTDLAFVAALAAALCGLRLHLRGVGAAFCAIAYVFVLANTASAAHCKNAYFCLRYLAITLYLLAVPALMLHLVALYGPRYLDRLYTAFFFAVAVAAIVGILARMGLMPGPAWLYFRSGDGLRLSPFFKDPNVYAPYLAAGGMLLLGHVVAGSRRLALGFTLAALIWVPMLLAFSRAAWLAMAVSVLVFATLLPLLRPGRAAMRRLAMVGWAGLLVLIPASALFLAAFDLLGFFEHRLGLQSYDEDRFGGHAAGVAAALEQPWGIGPGHFVGRTYFAGSDFALAAHNVFIKIWVENTFLGLVSFLALHAYLLLQLLRLAARQGPRAPIHVALIAALIGTLVNGYFIDTLHWRHLFVLMGFALAEIQLGTRRSQPAPSRPLDAGALLTSPRRLAIDPLAGRL